MLAPRHNERTRALRGGRLNYGRVGCVGPAALRSTAREVAMTSCCGVDASARMVRTRWRTVCHTRTDTCDAAAHARRAPTPRRTRAMSTATTCTLTCASTRGLAGVHGERMAVGGRRSDVADRAVRARRIDLHGSCTNPRGHGGAATATPASRTPSKALCTHRNYTGAWVEGSSCRAPCQVAVEQ